MCISVYPDIVLVTCLRASSLVSGVVCFSIYFKLFLVASLCSFSQHASATKMNTNNLALVFGPTLLAPPPEMDAITLAQHTTTINLVTLTMVENRETIFGHIGESHVCNSPLPTLHVLAFLGLCLSSYHLVM